MVQGSSSEVGKSVLVAALCRWLCREGYKTAPFKSQNMALNAVVTPAGGEIGWAQAMQAEAACTPPLPEMNPVLLKPVSDTVCQVVVHGKAVGNMSAREYQHYKKEAFPVVLAALDDLCRRFDVVVIEGAGSPAEINLREHDIVNMRIAKAAGSPVLLVADIDRGGAFAYVAGTLALLKEDERELVRGVIINKFRGDLERLQPGLTALENLTGKPVVGVLPYLNGLSLPAEDSLGLRREAVGEGDLDIAVVNLPRIANFTDYHILGMEGVRLRYLSAADSLGQPHLIILPGTKNTLADLQYLRESGLAAKILSACRAGSCLLGICGGYQMMGQIIRDSSGCDGRGGTEQGLGLLPVDTEFREEKTTTLVTGETLEYGEYLEGYEIHMGQTRRLDCRPFARLKRPDGTEYFDGAVSAEGRVLGTYLHGLFDSPAFRGGFLNRLRLMHGLPRRGSDGLSARERREQSYLLLERAVRENLDTAFLKKLLAEK
jgi:adenosylcobyric acid synthase